MASGSSRKFKCTYCSDDVVGIRVKCVECADFDLCLQCFSTGAEIGSHKNDHSYQFVDSFAVSVLCKKWTEKEELQLLYGIEKHGYGNWEDISKHLASRTAEEAKDEYVARFIDGSIGRATWPEAYEKQSRLIDLTKDEPPPCQQHAVPPLDVNPEQAELLGYMPHRDDFDCEYDNDAETLVPLLTTSACTTDDDELEIALKLAQVDMYVEKLRERTRRKKICRDYQLIGKFFSSRDRFRALRQQTPEQEFEEKLRWMSQLQTSKEQDCLVKNLLRQKELQHRLSELLKYRRNGITRIEEIPHFEQELQVSKGSGSSTLHSQTATAKRKRENERKEHSSNTKNSTFPTVNPSSLPGQGRRLLLGGFHPHLSEPSKHLLSKSEAQLCSALEITPSQFISTKTLLLANPHKKAESSPEKQIQQYIKSSGWFLTTN